jgi:hypothetical protein
MALSAEQIQATHRATRVRADSRERSRCLPGRTRRFGVETRKRFSRPRTPSPSGRACTTSSGSRSRFPPCLKLTEKQVKSIAKFNFLYMSTFPAIAEDQYPERLRESRLGQGASSVPQSVECASLLKASGSRSRRPCKAQLATTKTATRTIGSWRWCNDSELGVLAIRATRISRGRDSVRHRQVVTGFPKKGTRLPTGEEWNFVGNLFNWLQRAPLTCPSRISAPRMRGNGVKTSAQSFRVVSSSAALKSGGLAAVHDLAGMQRLPVLASASASWQFCSLRSGIRRFTSTGAGPFFLS